MYTEGAKVKHGRGVEMGCEKSELRGNCELSSEQLAGWLELPVAMIWKPMEK